MRGGELQLLWILVPHRRNSFPQKTGWHVLCFSSSVITWRPSCPCSVIRSAVGWPNHPRQLQKQNAIIWPCRSLGLALLYWHFTDYGLNIKTYDKLIKHNELSKIKMLEATNRSAVSVFCCSDIVLDIFLHTLTVLIFFWVTRVFMVVCWCLFFQTRTLPNRPRCQATAGMDWTG